MDKFSIKDVEKISKALELLSEVERSFLKRNGLIILTARPLRYRLLHIAILSLVSFVDYETEKIN